MDGNTSNQIIETAKALGATLAGIAGVDALKKSSSYSIYDRSPYYEGYEQVDWPVEARSVLVLALAHDVSEPELDWWSNIPGRTPGNRLLMELSKSLKEWLADGLGIQARSLAYQVEKGGILLKDSAALAGLGAIGKNNLLITPQYGPRVRLRALFLDADLAPTGPPDYDPCRGCDMPCRAACPMDAFRNGDYGRPFCTEKMRENEANEVLVEKWAGSDTPSRVVKYCRSCETSCPVAQKER